MRPFFVAIAGLAAAPGLTFTREGVAANDCRIAGGEYDYLRAVCDMTGFHEYVPFVTRHTGLMWYTLALALVFLSGIVIESLPRLRMYARLPLWELARRRLALGSENSS